MPELSRNREYVRLRFPNSSPCRLATGIPGLRSVADGLVVNSPNFRPIGMRRGFPSSGRLCSFKVDDARGRSTSAMLAGRVPPGEPHTAASRVDQPEFSVTIEREWANVSSAVGTGLAGDSRFSSLPMPEDRHLVIRRISGAFQRQGVVVPRAVGHARPDFRQVARISSGVSDASSRP